MECFVKVRVLRWQDWEEFFNRECATRLIESASVRSIRLYKDEEDPSVFGYMISYANYDQFTQYFQSEEFEDVMGSQGSCWDILHKSYEASRMVS